MFYLYRFSRHKPRRRGPQANRRGVRFAPPRGCGSDHCLLCALCTFKFERRPSSGSSQKSPLGVIGKGSSSAGASGENAYDAEEATGSGFSVLCSVLTAASAPSAPGRNVAVQLGGRPSVLLLCCPWPCQRQRVPGRMPCGRNEGRALGRVVWRGPGSGR